MDIRARGKTKTGQWFSGFYCEDERGDAIIFRSLESSDNNILTRRMACACHPVTDVCRYLGTIKSVGLDIDIYEKDVLEVFLNRSISYFLIVEYDGFCGFTFRGKYRGKVYRSRKTREYFAKKACVRVKGNLVDNPEYIDLVT